MVKVSTPRQDRSLPATASKDLRVAAAQWLSRETTADQNLKHACLFGPKNQ